MSQNCLETSGTLSLKCPTYFIISCKNRGLASFSCHAHHHALLVNSIYMSVYIVSNVFNTNDGNRRGHVNQTYLFLIFCDGWLWAQLIPIKQFPQRKWNDSLSHRNDIKNVFPFHYSSFIFWSQMLFRTRGQSSDLVPVLFRIFYTISIICRLFFKVLFIFTANYLFWSTGPFKG